MMTSDWQPIETAPKDGTQFLSASKSVDDHAKWVIVPARFHQGDFRTMLQEISMKEHNWWRGWPITYWMPLPDPPADLLSGISPVEKDQDKDHGAALAAVPAIPDVAERVPASDYHADFQRLWKQVVCEHTRTGHQAHGRYCDDCDLWWPTHSNPRPYALTALLEFDRREPKPLAALPRGQDTP